PHLLGAARRRTRRDRRRPAIAAQHTLVRDNVRRLMATSTTTSTAPVAAPVADPSNAVGPRIRALREPTRRSLRDLAQRCGQSAPMLSQVERGETSPTLASAAKIAAGLELTLSQLLRLDEGHNVAVSRASGRRSAERGGHRI